MRLKVKFLKDIGHLTKSVGHTQSTLVGHVKRPRYRWRSGMLVGKHIVKFGFIDINGNLI